MRDETKNNKDQEPKKQPQEATEAKKEKYSIIEKIHSLSTKLGLKPGHETLVEIEDTDDPHIKQLRLIQGSWDSEDPWFAIEKKNDKKAYAFIPAEAFSHLIDTLRRTQQENFNLKLEKTIWQNVPADFEDVWVVAMEEIRKYAKEKNPDKPVSIDLDKLIKKIKREHPNLFINIRDFMPQEMQQLQDNHD